MLYDRVSAVRVECKWKMYTPLDGSDVLDEVFCAESGSLRWLVEAVRVV